MATAPPAREEISAPWPNPSNAVARSGLGKLWDALFGVDSLYAAWSTAAGGPTAASGAFSDAAYTLRYRRFGKTVFFSLRIDIIGNGTAANFILIPLPFTANTESAFGGRESQTDGTGVIATVAAGSSSMTILKYNNTYPGGNGRRIAINGTLEIQ